MIHLTTYNKSYGQKKGQESKCQFESQPLKVKNLPKLLFFLQFLIWRSWEKNYLGVALMVSHKKYYKGEGDGFPQVRTMVNLLWVHVCMWLLCAPKMLQLSINQLVVWFMQVDMNN
jgi:hypothetical protein